MPDWYDSRTGFDRHTRKRIAELIQKNRASSTGGVLDVGCGDGEILRRLMGTRLGIDPDPVRVQRCDSLSISAMVIRWENFEPVVCFNDIILTGILEHVDSPEALLDKVKKVWLSLGGRVHIAVPNGLSLHRRVGKAMGLVSRPDEVTEQDIEVGHQRIFTPISLDLLLSSCGLKILTWEGVLLKPLSSQQMNDWPDDVISGLMEVGRHLPDYCAEIYVCAEVAT